jgi:hypothetical protein
VADWRSRHHDEHHDRGDHYQRGRAYPQRDAPAAGLAGGDIRPPDLLGQLGALPNLVAHARSSLRSQRSRGTSALHP